MSDVIQGNKYRIQAPIKRRAGEALRISAHSGKKGKRKEKKEKGAEGNIIHSPKILSSKLIENLHLFAHNKVVGGRREGKREGRKFGFRFRWRGEATIKG